MTRERLPDTSLLTCGLFTKHNRQMTSVYSLRMTGVNNVTRSQEKGPTIKPEFCPI